MQRNLQYLFFALNGPLFIFLMMDMNNCGACQNLNLTPFVDEIPK